MLPEYLLVAFAALLGNFQAVQAAPTVLEARAVTTLSSTQVSAYRPYSHYAGAAACSPDTTIAWNCGTHCSASPNFYPVASGGDGAVVQYWYVGYDSVLQTVIVGYQGTDASKILPVVTDVNIFFTTLDPSLFPGLSSSIEVHEGFATAHAVSATDVLSAVQTTMSIFAAKKVTIVGHSLGGAIAHLAQVYLPLHLPSTTTFKLVTYGSPRVGNQAFVDYFNTHASDVSRIDNRSDPVPICPGRFLGFAHVNGEKHILDSLAWDDCPGQDNTDSQCTIGYVPNIFVGNTADHSGPYDGIMLGC